MSYDVGFLSIHCCAIKNITDPVTNITWTSDEYLPKAVGTCEDVSFPSISTSRYSLARVFSADNQNSWCYYLQIVQGQDYLVRTTFLYGPVFRSIDETLFNISIGSTSISQVNSSLQSFVAEGIFAATGNNVNICLVKEKGNAYISMIELRPLNDKIYFDGDSSILKLVSRVDLGNEKTSYRYASSSGISTSWLFIISFFLFDEFISLVSSGIQWTLLTAFGILIQISPGALP